MCNEPIAEEDAVCMNCGTDLRLYKRILHLSNSYYNAGLYKARVRDMTGAADCLRQSLKLNKKNIDARNLLGLIYYETGETVQALAQWVISTNYQPKKNIANSYLNEVQTNNTKLDLVDQTIKKFNQALLYCQQGSEDLAIIQLKKVLSMSPKLVKGHQLMALANGMDTYKLKYGHRGGNHPVKDLETGRVYISSQNHGYAVDNATISPEIAEPAFINVNDGTNEGLKYTGKNIFTVQYHPEACPGPLDSGYLFDRFLKMMEVND